MRRNSESFGIDLLECLGFSRFSPAWGHRRYAPPCRNTPPGFLSLGYRPFRKYLARSWGVSGGISALEGKNTFMPTQKNRRAGQMSQPNKENYENTKHNNERHHNGDSCGYRHHLDNR